MDIENAYMCGYLKIKGLTDEYPTLTTFFDGEIIGDKHRFLTRKWDADEEVIQNNVRLERDTYNYRNIIFHMLYWANRRSIGNTG